MAKWENNEVKLLVLATLAILAGTIVTMVMPFAWVNAESNRIEAVKPYAPLELAGRDIYIREGCNNCHTQTVRPLVSEVVRYGPYSKSGEFNYDQPFLWGSRRTGPDLARIGGKYADEWHERHLTDPRNIVPGSNMPAYAFLAQEKIDPAETKHKMEVLGFPFSEDQIAALEGKTEMNALVAYLQKLGSDIGWRDQLKLEIVGEPKNPLQPDAATVAAGESLYQVYCGGCHGKQLEGDIGPELVGAYDDSAIFTAAYQGLTDAGMPSFAHLGTNRLWKIITFVQSRKADEE